MKIGRASPLNSFVLIQYGSSVLDLGVKRHREICHGAETESPYGVVRAPSTPLANESKLLPTTSYSPKSISAAMTKMMTSVAVSLSTHRKTVSRMRKNLFDELCC